MKRVLLVAGIAEAATGAGLLIAPPLVGRLLLGEELVGVGVPVARVLGIALIALAIACRSGRTGLIGMLVYSATVTLYLGYLGLAGGYGGTLLWPAVVAHAVINVGCVAGLRRMQPAHDARA